MSRKQPICGDWVIRRPAFANMAPAQITNRSALAEFDSVELKMDGIWGTAVFEPGRPTRIYSRHGQLKKTEPAPSSFPFAGRCVVYGELMHRSTWGLERGIDGMFFAWDCAEINGLDATTSPLRQRRAWAAEIIKSAGDWAVMGEQFPVGQAASVWDRYVIGRGYEGLVFKNNARLDCAAWARMKRTMDVDYVCMGFTESTAGRHKGRMVRGVVGGLYHGSALVRTVNVSGLTDEQRRDFFRSPAAHIGRVFTATGNRIFKGGSLRHPRFACWHKDKIGRECTIEAASSAAPPVIMEMSR